MTHSATKLLVLVPAIMHLVKGHPPLLQLYYSPGPIHDITQRPLSDRPGFLITRTEGCEEISVTLNPKISFSRLNETHLLIFFEIYYLYISQKMQQFLKLGCHGTRFPWQQYRKNEFQLKSYPIIYMIEPSGIHKYTNLFYNCKIFIQF